MTVKTLSLLVVLPCLLLSLPALSAQATLKPQTQGEVVFVSGGIGTDERAELKAMRSNYNLSLMFSQKSGEFLSDVKVRITDSNDRIVLETVSAGPQLLAHLAAGNYNVNAEFGGKRMDKKVAVSNKQQSTASFVWP